MTALTANGYPVFSGSITAPESGAWWAEIQTAAPLVTGDAVTISDGTTELKGTVAQGGAAVSRTVARIVGGAGKLTGQIDPIHRKGASVGEILGAICRASGESKSAAVLPTFAARVYPFWTQPAESGGQALRNLADSCGAVWRVLRDGTVWLGDPDMGIPEPDYTVLEPHPEDLSFDVAPEGLSLWVGSLQNGSAVKRVEYAMGDALRCTYWL